VVAITAERGLRVNRPKLVPAAVTLSMVILLCVLPQGYPMAMCAFKGPAHW
jgi:hypothetical protein